MTTMTHEQEHSGGLIQGLVVFIFLVFLTLVEFLIAITNDDVLLLAMVGVIKTGLVVYYYMHIYKLGEVDTNNDPHSAAYKLISNRWGLWLFILSDSFLFGGLLVTRFNLLGLTRPDLNQYLGLTVTLVLLISSFFMNRAETQIALGNRRAFLISTAITILLGIAFLAGVIGVEWRDAPFAPGDSTYSAVFFMMTGLHAFHVLTGVILLLIVLRNGMRGRYSADAHWAVEAATIYWHFVDVAWIFFYPALYLIGHLS